MKNSVNRGFMLIKLLIVIALLGILLSLATPSIEDWLERNSEESKNELNLEQNDPDSVYPSGD